MKLLAAIPLAPEHGAAETEIAFVVAAADKEYIAHSFSDGSVYVSNIKGKLLYRFADPIHCTRAIAFWSNEVILGSEDGSIRAYDLDSGELNRIFKKTSRAAVHSFLRPSDYNNTSLLASYTDGTVNLFHINIGECYNFFEGHKKVVNCLDLLDDILVSSDDHGSCCTWDYKKGEQIWRVNRDNESGIICQVIWALKQSTTRGQQIAKAKRQGRVAVGLRDERIKVYELSTGALLETLRSGPGIPSHLFYHHDHLISFAQGVVRLWSAKGDTYGITRTIQMFDHDGSSAALCNNTIIATGSDSEDGSAAAESAKGWMIKDKDEGSSGKVSTIGSPSHKVRSVVSLGGRVVVALLKEGKWIAEIW